MSLSFYFLPHKKRFSFISASLKFWYIQCFLELTVLMTLILMICLKLICNLKILNFFLYYHFTFFQPMINFKNKEHGFLFAFMKKIHLTYHCTKDFLFHKKISSINVSKSAGNCGCIFAQCISSLTDVCKFQLDERALLELNLIFLWIHYIIKFTWFSHNHWNQC